MYMIKITIIEDNIYARTGWETALNSEDDFIVLNSFSSCEEALNSTSIRNSDIILLDIGLPGMNGIEGAEKIKGWCRVVYTDATIGMIIGNTVTITFLMAGAGILGPKELAPTGTEVATTLANIFSSQWGSIGGFLFMFSATIALIGTQLGQLAGWPRLLADSFRICIPRFQKTFIWKTQFRIFLIFFLTTNMIIVYSFGLRPVIIVQTGAILDGLILTPLQALWVGIGLYFIMPKMFKKEAWTLIKPHWLLAFGLVIAFFVFGYFCVFQIPYIL